MSLILSKSPFFGGVFCSEATDHFNWLSQKLSDTFRNVRSQCNPIPTSEWEMGEEEKKKGEEAEEWQSERRIFVNGSVSANSTTQIHSDKKFGGVQMRKFNKSLFLLYTKQLIPLDRYVLFYSFSCSLNVCTLYQIMNKSNFVWGCSYHICSFVHAKAIIMNQWSNAHHGCVFDDAKNIDKLFDDWEKME